VLQFGVSSASNNNLVPDSSNISFFAAPASGNGGSQLLFAPSGATGETVGALISLAPNAGTITTITGTASPIYTFTIGGGNQSGDYSGVISEKALNASTAASLALVKIGSGTQSFSGTNNSYTGATTISGGTLSVTLLANGNSNSSIGKSTNAATNLILDGGTLQYIGAAASTDRLFTLTQNGGTIDASGINISGSGAISFTNAGNIALIGTTARTLTLTGTNPGANTLAPVITDVSVGNATSLVKDGVGQWVLTGANLYSGTTNINAGTLQAGAANTLSSGSAITVAAGALLDLNGNNQTIGSVAGAGNIAFGNANAILNTGGNNASTTVSGVVSGVGILNKTGTGTMILTANNSFDGNVNVNGGTFLVNGQGATESGTGTASVFVNPGGTFGGTGRSNGVAFQVAAGGTLRGGDQNLVGSLELSGNVDLADGSTLGIRITDGSTPSNTPGGSPIGGTPNPTSNNFIHVTNGGLTANSGGILITVDGTGVTFARQAYSYQIATIDGQDMSLLNITNQSQFSTTGFSSPYQFTLTGDINGAIFLNINPVPEPAMVFGLAAGVLGLGGLVRRNRRARVTAP